MYDEFGNLKKKFRAKTHQADTSQGVPGVGRAGWEVEELGIFLDYFSLMQCIDLYNFKLLNMLVG